MVTHLSTNRTQCRGTFVGLTNDAISSAKLPLCLSLILSSCRWCTVKLMVYMLCSYNGWLAGYQTVFDTAKSKVTQNNFAIGYSKDDITLHTTVLVYHRISYVGLSVSPRHRSILMIHEFVLPVHCAHFNVFLQLPQI